MRHYTRYKDNIRKKILEFRTVGQGTPLETVQRTIKELIGELEQQEKLSRSNAPSAAGTNLAIEPSEQPVPVVVPGEGRLRKLFPAALGPVLGILATGALVVVLVIFMLIQLNELRDRVMALVGYGRLSTTTKALDEAGERISLVCIGALPPEALAPARYLCKRLREAFPNLAVLVNHWGREATPETEQQWLAAGATAVRPTLLDTRDQILQCLVLRPTGAESRKKAI